MNDIYTIMIAPVGARHRIALRHLTRLLCRECRLYSYDAVADEASPMDETLSRILMYGKRSTNKEKIAFVREAPR